MALSKKCTFVINSFTFPCFELESTNVGTCSSRTENIYVHKTDVQWLQDFRQNNSSPSWLRNKEHKANKSSIVLIVSIFNMEATSRFAALTTRISMKVNTRFAFPIYINLGGTAFSSSRFVYMCFIVGPKNKTTVVLCIAN